MSDASRSSPCRRAILYRYSVPDATAPAFELGGRRPWALTILICIAYTLMLSYMMVTSRRVVCLLGLRKNALGATVLYLSAGLPDLLTMILVRRPDPGMVEMAAPTPSTPSPSMASSRSGCRGSSSDRTPTSSCRAAPGSMLVDFVCIALGLLALLVNRLRISRGLEYVLLRCTRSTW